MRLRKGSANTQRGAERFVDELIARVRRAGSAGEILVRADSGFWNKKITARLRAKGCLYSIGVRITKPVAAAIEQIEESAWRPLADYPKTGEAEIAETTLGADRLIVCRVRTLDDQQQLFATFKHFGFVTNRDEPLELVEREHGEHAVIAHNLHRWSVLISLPDQRPSRARTIRRRLLERPGRLTRSARRWTLHLPARWPWEADFLAVLARIRALPAPG